MEKERKDIFFVEVVDPEEVRRNILESLKDVVENLQRFEKFKETRKEKIKNINKLGMTIKELNKLVADLKNTLPQTKIRAVKVKEHKTSRRGRKHVAKAEGQKNKPLSELQKLESELSEIENKLGSLR